MSECWLFIVTGRAGFRARRMLEPAAREFRAHGIAWEAVYTQHAGHAEQLAVQAGEDGRSGVAVIGGDGTVHEVVNGLAGFPDVRVGILPCGRGNDAARALGIPRAPDEAARILTRGTCGSMDLGAIGDRRFLTVACVGIDARVATAALAGSGRLRGRISYVFGLAREVARLETAVMEISGEFGTLTGPHLLAAVCNTPFYGGGIPIGPDADPRDGVLDVCAVGSVKRRRLLACLPAAARGGHGRLKEVSMLRSRTVTIDCEISLSVVADGEGVGTTPVTIGVLPTALRVMVPADSPLRS